jgi:hypothetical protein
MVVEEITNRPIGARATVKLYRITLSPFDTIRGGPPDFESKYLYEDAPLGEWPGPLEKKWICEIYIHPQQRLNFKSGRFFQRLQPFLEPNYQIHDLYGD